MSLDSRAGEVPPDGTREIDAVEVRLLKAGGLDPVAEARRCARVQFNAHKFI